MRQASGLGEKREKRKRGTKEGEKHKARLLSRSPPAIYATVGLHRLRLRTRTLKQRRLGALGQLDHFVGMVLISPRAPRQRPSCVSHSGLQTWSSCHCPLNASARDLNKVGMHAINLLPDLVQLDAASHALLRRTGHGEATGMDHPWLHAHHSSLAVD